MATKPAVRGRKPTVRNAVLLSLRADGPQTAKDLSTSVAYLRTLVEGGYIVQAGTVKQTPGRGRPNHTFKLSKRGQGIALNLSKAVQKAQEAEVEAEVVNPDKLIEVPEVVNITPVEVAEAIAA
jgi:predicted ArsR family transcriptional regulator